MVNSANENVPPGLYIAESGNNSSGWSEPTFRTSQADAIAYFKEASMSSSEGSLYTSSLVSDIIHIANLGGNIPDSRADDILQDLWTDIENYRNHCSLEKLKRVHYSTALEKALLCLKINNRN